jgi:hypothetical protein
MGKWKTSGRGRILVLLLSGGNRDLALLSANLGTSEAQANGAQDAQVVAGNNSRDSCPLS